MAKAVVSLFDSLDAAKAARQRLVERGFHDVRVRIVGPNPELDTGPVMSKDAADIDERGSDQRGVAGVVSRMLSGWLIEDRVSQYAQAVRGGKTLVALDVDDAAAAETAAGILKEVHAEQEPPAAARRSEGTPPAPTVDPTDTLTLPQVYPLPNAPTDWDEATLGERSGVDVSSDPARPAGAVRDAAGLGTDDTDDTLKARKAARTRGRARK